MLMSPRSLLLLLLGVSWCRGVDTWVVTGSDVTFRTDVSERPSEITWFKDTSIIVELEEGKEPTFYKLQDRVIADLQTGTLIFKAVTPEDNGRYKAERVVAGGRILAQFFTLQVQDHVCQVVIRNTTVENNVTLSCTCPDQTVPPSKYKWVNKSADVVVSNDQNITVQKTKEPQPYRCEASNDVSSSNTTVTVPALIEPRKPLSPGGVAAIVIVIIIIIFTTLVLVLWKRKKLNFLIKWCSRGSKGNEDHKDSKLRKKLNKDDRDQPTSEIPD